MWECVCKMDQTYIFMYVGIAYSLIYSWTYTYIIMIKDLFVPPPPLSIFCPPPLHSPSPFISPHLFLPFSPFPFSIIVSSSPPPPPPPTPLSFASLLSSFPLSSLPPPLCPLLVCFQGCMLLGGKGDNDISSYIFKPIQRICKYPLLFRVSAHVLHICLVT